MKKEKQVRSYIEKSNYHFKRSLIDSVATQNQRDYSNRWWEAADYLHGGDSVVKHKEIMRRLRDGDIATINALNAYNAEFNTGKKKNPRSSGP